MIRMERRQLLMATADIRIPRFSRKSAAMFRALTVIFEPVVTHFKAPELTSGSWDCQGRRACKIELGGPATLIPRP